MRKLLVLNISSNPRLQTLALKVANAKNLPQGAVKIQPTYTSTHGSRPNNTIPKVERSIWGPTLESEPQYRDPYYHNEFRHEQDPNRSSGSAARLCSGVSRPSSDASWERRPAAHSLGPCSFDAGLLRGTVACCFGLLPLPNGSTSDGSL